MEKKTGVFQGAVRNKRKRDAFEEEEETAAAAVTRSRRRRRRIAFPDRRKGRKGKVSVRKRETSEEEEEEDSSSNPDDGKQEESGCSEEYEANIWEGEGMFEVEDDGDWVPLSRSAAASSTSSSSAILCGEGPLKEVSSSQQLQQRKEHLQEVQKKRASSKEEGREGLNSILEGNAADWWVENSEEEGSGSSNSSSSDSSSAKSTRYLGAILPSPPKVLSKSGAAAAEKRRGRKRKSAPTSTSLEEVVKEISKERMRKSREKEKFEEAGWKRVENIQKWRWTYSRVPPERRVMMIDLPPRGHMTRLAVFSLYFSDAFIFALLSRRENEMRTYWSPTGYSITVDLRMIKQVRKISHSKIEIAAAAAENVWNLTFFQLDAGLYNIYHWDQKVSST